ncbi:MAG: glycosyltransferase family 4 protein [Anaerolineae bacterium]
MRVIYTSAPKLAGAGMGYTAYQLALGIQEAGYLAKLICGYAAPNSIDPRLLRTFPLFKAIAWLSRDHTAIRDMIFDLIAARCVDSSDIVQGWSHQCLYTLRRAKKLGAVAFLERPSAHDVALLELMTEEENRFGYRRHDPARRLGLRRGLDEYEIADFITVPSEFSYDSMLARGIPEGKLILNPYGVDIDCFKPRPQEDKTFRALFVGNVALHKGVPYLLDAWKQAHLPGAELVLAGRVAPNGKAILARYKDTSGIEAFGYVRDIARLYNSATMFVFPSLSEGSALVTYEALASGLPVVTTPNSGSVVRDGKEGFLVPIRDVEALRERIVCLYQNPTLRAQMAEAARARAQEYTWEKSRRRLLDAYEGALNQADNPGT